MRTLTTGFLLVLAAWGVALGAWLSTVATLAWAALLWRKRTCSRSLAIAGAVAVVALAGPIEVLWSVHDIGGRSRAGDLGWRDKVAVYGFNVVFSSAAVAAGFSAFGMESFSLGLPVSIAGACPEDRLRRYGSALPRAYAGHTPRLRVWHSDLPMRSPRFRKIVRDWASGLSGSKPRQLGPVGPFTWKGSAYISTDEANQVPVALNAPTTRMSGEAVRDGDRWRLDLSVDLALAYPERATFQIGPFALEEGIFHDARPLLQPYCAEYRWSVYADDPALQSTEPIRGPFERASTALLRAAGAGYR